MDCPRFGATRLALAAFGVLVLGCGREDKQPAAGFDPKFIASEADKGNLRPLKELNAACAAEVKSAGKRLAACRAQDEVRTLVHSIDVRL